MGYPSDILSTRAVIRPGKYVVIPPEGLVNNVIPGIENCRGEHRWPLRRDGWCRRRAGQ